MSLDPTSVPAEWHLNPSNGLSRVHERDRRQTTLWRITCARALPPISKITTQLLLLVFSQKGLANKLRELLELLD